MNVFSLKNTTILVKVGINKGVDGLLFKQGEIY